MRFSSARVLAVAVAALPFTAIRAQMTPANRDSIGRDDRNFSFYSRGPYRPGVPRPESILGYNVGDLNTQFALQERVLLAIAGAARDRVRVEQIGWTPERRAMRLYIVSSPENIARLDAIRGDLARLADPRAVGAAGGAAPGGVGGAGGQSAAPKGRLSDVEDTAEERGGPRSGSGETLRVPPRSSAVSFPTVPLRGDTAARSGARRPAP